MARGRAPRTVLEYAVARAGLVKGAKVAEFVAMWAIAADQLGHRVTVEEVAEWWGSGISARTLYRRLAEFRQAFPEHDTPQPIVDYLAARRVELKQRNAAAVATAAVDLSGLVAA